jgi:ribosomal protein S18 acetylase RimI-like enzyme
MIRVATAEDASNLAALSIQVWLHTYTKQGLRNALSNYVLEEFTREKMATAIADRNTLIAIFERGPALLGYVKIHLAAPCEQDESLTSEIATLYVQEHFAGKGIGTSLLEFALAHCRDSKGRGAWLKVNHENLAAISFYEKHRFRKLGSTFFHLENETHENYVLARTRD